jgi:phosphoglycerol transferase MdoB-like AlkP superfamily enzyme
MSSASRFNEYKVLIYRILLSYFFYSVARILFYLYNSKALKIDTFSDFLSLSYHGLVFDTTAILYTNSLFILFSIFPFYINTKKGYQTFLKYLYIIPNFIACGTNFVDFIYYRYNFGRSTIAFLEVIENESNLPSMMVRFMFTYWHVLLLLIFCFWFWLFLYNQVKVKEVKINAKINYFLVSVIGFLVIVALCIGGIRGDFKKSTRPINLIDASRYITNPNQADFVLNTPFALIRTISSNSFKKVNFVSQNTINELIAPVKNYSNNPQTQPNVVLFILESNGREYYGCLNKNTKIPNYQSYTPFMDSLATKSLIFSNAHANGYKSIHAMSSVLAGIPSFKNAFTSSPYPKQKTESLVSTLESIGYNTSFFHGAPNGSMGFLGYGNILGFDKYYGKTEYNNDADFDGSWGIWDEPFFQYFNKTISKQKQPFFSTLFSVTSHEPYVIPKKYEGKFPEGSIIMHKCIGYTDYSLKQFFASAKKEAWFKNTLFVFVGDHSNMVAYEEYNKDINRQSIVTMIYKPNSNLIGENSDYAQQIDLYPTVLDIIGYPKPFRSWGRSLINEKKIPPFAIKYANNTYEFMSGNYICVFDGKKAIGFYDKDDKVLANNLIKNKNLEMNLLETRCKAFIQDYMARVVDRKLAK